jgi:glycosyltransferase involved in cell wall biosynthesis
MFSKLSVYDILNRYKVHDNIYGNYILFFGRIESYKGVDLLIDAFFKSNLLSKGVKLVIAGKGRIVHDKSALPQNVVLINRFIENEELANLIFHCKYVVLPYLSATQSGCVMSAYAFNKPVLATDVGDFSLTIENCSTGLICKANDEFSLCNALNTLNEMNLNDMQSNIEKKYQRNGAFSWHRIAMDLADGYKKI